MTRITPSPAVPTGVPPAVDVAASALATASSKLALAARRSALSLVPAGTAQWRLVAGGGRVVGHVQLVLAAGDTRFRARRYSPTAHAFRDLGDFWSADDAIECIRYAR